MAQQNVLRGFGYELIPFRITGVGDNILRAAIVANTAGVGALHIVVCRLALIVDGASQVKFMSGSGTPGEEISGVLADGGINQPRQYKGEDWEYGLFWTNKGEPLILNHSAGGIAAHGHALIVLVPEMPVITEIIIP